MPKHIPKKSKTNNKKVKNKNKNKNNKNKNTNKITVNVNSNNKNKNKAGQQKNQAPQSIPMPIPIPMPSPMPMYSQPTQNDFGIGFHKLLDGLSTRMNTLQEENQHLRNNSLIDDQKRRDYVDRLQAEQYQQEQHQLSQQRQDGLYNFSKLNKDLDKKSKINDDLLDNVANFQSNLLMPDMQENNWIIYNKPLQIKDNDYLSDGYLSDDNSMHDIANNLNSTLKNIQKQKEETERLPDIIDLFEQKKEKDHSLQPIELFGNNENQLIDELDQDLIDEKELDQQLKHQVEKMEKYNENQIIIQQNKKAKAEATADEFRKKKLMGNTFDKLVLNVYDEQNNTEKAKANAEDLRIECNIKYLKKLDEINNDNNAGNTDKLIEEIINNKNFKDDLVKHNVDAIIGTEYNDFFLLSKNKKQYKIPYNEMINMYKEFNLNFLKLKTPEMLENENFIIYLNGMSGKFDIDLYKQGVRYSKSHKLVSNNFLLDMYKDFIKQT